MLKTLSEIFFSSGFRFPSRSLCQSAAAESQLTIKGFFKHVALLFGSPDFFVAIVRAPKLYVNRLACAFAPQVTHAAIVAAVKGIRHTQD